MLLCSLVVIGFSAMGYCQERVGGPCAYDEYKGTCQATGKDKDGKVLFIYDGKVGGEKISLVDNVADEGLKPDAKMDCFLMFIKKGTCTPCLFSVGSCGKEAWDYYRNVKSIEAKAGAADPLKAGGCSLCD